jgi:HSP20 family protein
MEPAAGVVTPVADVYETGEAFVVKLDMPGVTKESITLSVDPQYLSVRASLTNTHGENARFLLNEMGAKQYVREFKLGEGIDHRTVQAEFLNGVLTITLPKTDAFRAKEIHIQ